VVFEHHPAVATQQRVVDTCRDTTPVAKPECLVRLLPWLEHSIAAMISYPRVTLSEPHLVVASEPVRATVRSRSYSQCDGGGLADR